MSRFILPFAALLALAACDGPAVVDPNTGGVDGGETDGSDGGGEETVSLSVPEELSVNLTGLIYDGETLMVEISSLDTTPLVAEYDRAPALDISGYKAFKMQEDALDRMFIALAGTSPDGSVTAATVADGGQFNKYFAGGIYSRTGTYQKPTIGEGPGAGQVSYSGTYAGLMNGGVTHSDPTSAMLPFPNEADESIRMQQSARVSGEVFLNANFEENAVNGAIYNRVIVDNGFDLADVILVPTAIAADGTFLGTAEDPAENGIGSYGGIFGGANANSVAGLIHIKDFIPEVEDEEEHGMFVLTQCGGPDSPVGVCDYAAPN